MLGAILITAVEIALVFLVLGAITAILPRVGVVLTCLVQIAAMAFVVLLGLVWLGGGLG